MHKHDDQGSSTVKSNMLGRELMGRAAPAQLVDKGSSG